MALSKPVKNLQDGVKVINKKLVEIRYIFLAFAVICFLAAIGIATQGLDISDLKADVSAVKAKVTEFASHNILVDNRLDRLDSITKEYRILESRLWQTQKLVKEQTVQIKILAAEVAILKDCK